MEQTSNICLLMLTHTMNSHLWSYLQMLKRSSQDIMDLYVLYDCAGGKPDILYGNDIPFHLFSSSDLPNFFHRGERQLPNPLLALIDFAHSHKYDRYLLMENDIVLSGDWCSFLKIIEREYDTDYIHIASDVLGGPLMHWPAKFIRRSPFLKLYFSWCQLFLVSHCYLMDLESFMQQNDSFYYEFLLPTMAYNGDYLVRQFENFGYNFQVSWGPVECYENKYQYERQNNTFYHPIKHLGIVDLA